MSPSIARTHRIRLCPANVILGLLFVFALLPAPVASQTELTPIRVAVSPIPYDTIPIRYALSTGMFTKAGLDVQLQMLPTGAAITAAVAGGSIDIGKSSVSPLVSAFSRGIPITLIAPAVLYDAKAPNGTLMALKSSVIKKASDLVGKTVGVNDLSDPTRLATETWLSQNGVSSDSVKFVEVRMSAIPAALERGRIDAGLITSPLMDDAMMTGKFRQVAPIMNALAPRFLFSAYFSQGDWAKSHADVVKRFVGVMAQAANITNARHKEMVPEIAALVSLPTDEIVHMTWPLTGTTLNPAEIQPVIDFAYTYHLIKQKFPASAMIYVPQAH